MKIIRLITTESTNSECFNYLKSITPVVVIAENQTKGKGRGTNTWESPEGNIYLSYGTIIKPRELENLSMNIAVGLFTLIQKALHSGIRKNLKLKWPNDLYLNNKKMAGILVESKITQNEAKVAIGIGLNYLNAPLKTAVSIKNLTDQTKEMIEYSIVETIVQLLSSSDFEKTRAVFNQNSYFESGDSILFNSGTLTQKAEFIGYEKNLSIILKINGVKKTFLSGEIQSLKTT